MNEADPPSNSSPDPPVPEPRPEVPSANSVRDYLLYGLSLPERAIRSTAGILGGTLRESAALLVPQSFRNAKTYQVFIGQMLDFMAEDMGGVDRSDRRGSPPIENFVARKTVGNFVELASLATLHMSPILLLAIVSDIAYGSKVYLKELAEDLEARGVIEDAAAVQQADDLLDAVAATSGKTAQAFDTPPLSVDGLRETIRQTRESLADIEASKVLTKEEIDRLWSRITSTAKGEGVSPLTVSGLMTLGTLDKLGKVGTGTLSTVRAAGSLFNRHVLDHYRDALGDINRNGFYPTLATTSRPYVDALWRNFSTDRETLTEEFVTSGGIARTWRRARRWVKAR